MSTEIFTFKRVAITETDFDIIPPARIFKIFDGFLTNSLISVKKYVKGTKMFCIAEFKNENDAKNIYQSLNHVEIEKTGEFFILSGVPDEIVDFGEMLEQSFSSKDFIYKNLVKNTKNNLKDCFPKK